MPIDLSSGPNIAAGWPGPPQLSAPNIGELVKSILTNRYLRDKMTQESIADTIKNVQAQRQGDAYAEALRNAGLTQGQDISGLSAPQATSLAQMIQGQTPDTDVDNLHKAMAHYYNARADDTTGDGSDGSGFGSEEFNAQYPPVRTNQFGIQEYRKVTKGAHGGVIVNYQPYSTPIQPTPVQQQSTRQTYQTEKDIEKQIDDLQLWRKIQEQQNIKDKQAGVPFARQAEEDTLRKQLEDVRQKRVNPPPADSDGTGGGGAKDPLTLRAEAMDAIARGANRDAVARKFHDMTGGVL